MKKTKEELEAIRKQTLDRMNLKGEYEKRVVVGLATCGMAAGATPVFEAFKALVAEKKLDKVDVEPTGCIGVCRLEPMVEVTEAGKEKVTYVKVTPEMAAEIVEKHLIGGEPVVEYTIGYFESHR